MKHAILRPLARADLRGEILYYRKHAGKLIANQLVVVADEALQHLQDYPGTGSPRIGQILDIAGLRSWRITGFPLIWFYFEYEDRLDVMRLLGERQDILSILNADSIVRQANAEDDCTGRF